MTVLAGPYAAAAGFTGGGYVSRGEILRTGIEISGDYLPSTPATVRVGRLPSRHCQPVATVSSGNQLTIDTLSHEGLQPDQGSDPLGFFRSFGVPPSRVLEESIDIAKLAALDAASLAAGEIGPHVITGPIYIDGAEPGDFLAVDIVTLQPRVDYGIVCNRHGRGALPDEMPEGAGIVSAFCSADWAAGTGELLTSSGKNIRFPLDPFLGIVGVAPAGDDAVSSVPPGSHGGNLDVRVARVGTTLYLPVFVPGALAYVGDPHFSQGDGEVALTAFEASLRATLRFRVIKQGSPQALALDGTTPLIETAENWHPIGLDLSLGDAMKDCVRKSMSLLDHRFEIERAAALAYLSAAAHFAVAQVVDQVQGVYSTIRKADFAEWQLPR